MRKLIFILITVGLIVYLSNQKLFKSLDESAQRITIAPGASAQSIAATLKENKIIRSEFIFLAWATLRGLNTKFQAGDFVVSSSASLNRVLKILTKPRNEEREITLIEGWTINQIKEYLIKQGLVTRLEIDAVLGEAAKDLRQKRGIKAKDFSSEFSFLLSKPLYVSLEGYIFPDTYRLNEGATAEEIARKTLENFDRKLTIAWRNEIARQKKTIFEVITMASIVEREVRSDADRALVADIFWRRLNRGMGLEADSTVNYATGKSLPAVTYADLKIDSLWNTYKYRGLPLGPIANPGTSSIKAAIYPEKNSYWYFLTTPRGEVIYAKTFEEHVANKRKYLKWWEANYE